jgi:hypothetical protein
VPEPLQDLDYSHPFAHRPLVEFLMAVPPDVLCRPGEPRKLMRHALWDLWPLKLRTRRSKGLFNAPWQEALRPLARVLLKAEQWHLVERGFVDRTTSSRGCSGSPTGSTATSLNCARSSTSNYGCAIGADARGSGPPKQKTLLSENRKEVRQMRENYETPELTLIGQTSEAVLGAGYWWQ